MMKLLKTLAVACVVTAVGIFGLQNSVAAPPGPPPGPPPGGGGVVSVNCDMGETIADALANGMPDEPLIVNIEGNCNENVTITRNDVTLRGIGPATSKIIGVPEADLVEESPITNYGAQRTIIENLTVEGGTSSGIALAGAANVRIRNCVIENHGFSGIFVGTGAWARIDGCTIQNNGSDGIRVDLGGFAQITNTTIQGNFRNGIAVRRQGTALIGVDILGDPGPNIIRLNDSGIFVDGPGRADISNNTIENNTNHGVFANLGGSVVLTNNTISGNGVYGLFINEGSNGRIEANNTIVSAAADFFVGAAVAVYRNSSLRIRGGGNTLENTAPRFITNNSGAAGGFALDVEMVSSLRVDGGQTTIIGNVESFNQTTVDLRNVRITGSVYADGLDGNVRFRDQSNPGPTDFTITGGNVYTFGDPVSIRGSGSQQPVFDGDIDCNGSFVFINSPTFNGAHGFVNCPGIP